MENKIQIIQNELIEGKPIPPRELANKRAILAGEYSFACGLLEEILKMKPALWNEMREKHKSDKATDREWEATEYGINETGLKLKLRRIEKMMNALSSLIRIAEGESKNSY